MSGTVERLLLRPGSARLLRKLCDSDNNLGSGVLERCETEGMRKMDVGLKKKKCTIDRTNTKSPFYVKPQDLPKQKIKRKVRNTP